MESTGLTTGMTALRWLKQVKIRLFNGVSILANRLRLYTFHLRSYFFQHCSFVSPHHDQRHELLDLVFRLHVPFLLVLRAPLKRLGVFGLL